MTEVRVIRERYVAPVELHVVDAPRRKRLSVLRVVAIAAGAGVRAVLQTGAGIDPELETKRVHVTDDGGDPLGELLRIRHELPVERPRGQVPSAIEVDVGVPESLHAGGDEE